MSFQVKRGSLVGPGLDSVAIDEAKRKKEAFEKQLAAADEKSKKIEAKAA